METATALDIINGLIATRQSEIQALTLARGIIEETLETENTQLATALARVAELEALYEPEEEPVEEELQP